MQPLFIIGVFILLFVVWIFLNSGNGVKEGFSWSGTMLPYADCVNLYTDMYSTSVESAPKPTAKESILASPLDLPLNDTQKPLSFIQTKGCPAVIDCRLPH